MRDLPLEQLADALRGFGGTPDSVLANLGLMEIIAPMLRADFSVNETYAYEEQPPLDVPITAFAATADARAGTDQVSAWEAQTTRGFRTYVLPGGHFAVLDHASFVRGRVAEALRNTRADGLLAPNPVRWVDARQSRSQSSQARW
jgi:medium-chain acyl-[acyl-carrier-protein] hydrolase